MPAQLFSELRAPSPAVSQALIVFAFPLREPTASFAQSGGPVPRVYVGNLAESVTRDDLRALFSKIGRVAGALVITGGTAKEPKSGRDFFLDYPCGMKKGDKVKIGHAVLIVVST